MKKTRDEINMEVEMLKEIQYSVPHYTLFGDDNWEKIAVQIEALEGCWNEDTAWDCFFVDEISDSEREAALKAIDWCNGTFDPYETDDGVLIDSPSKDWAELTK
jgi:hypothetical protein